MFHIYRICVLTVMFVQVDTAGAWEIRGEWKCLKLQTCMKFATEQLSPCPIPHCY